MQLCYDCEQLFKRQFGLYWKKDDHALNLVKARLSRKACNDCTEINKIIEEIEDSE